MKFIRKKTLWKKINRLSCLLEYWTEAYKESEKRYKKLMLRYNEVKNEKENL